MSSCIRFLVVLVGSFGVSAAIAQGWPAKAVTFVYPYPPGSNADTAWRTIGAEVARRTGQQVVHENRPGAGGRVGFDATRASAPDGYTISMFNNVLGVYQPLIDPRLAIEPVTDYTPIALVIETPLLLFANAGVPFRDVKGLIAFAKSNPGKLNSSSAGPGTGGHINIALFSQKAGVDIIHVPYKGTAPATTALASGEVQLSFTDASVKPFVDTGRIVPIAVGGTVRWSLFPNVPSLAEEGMPGYRGASWNGVAGPAKIPAEIVSRINRLFLDAANAPDVRAKLEATGWVIKGGSPADFLKFVREDIDALRPVVKAANIRFDQ